MLSSANIIVELVLTSFMASEVININKNKVIQSCRICFGGLSATPLRNRKLEDTLIGKDINFAMDEAERVTKKTIKPLSDLRGSSD